MITHTMISILRLSHHFRNIRSLGTALLTGAALSGSAAYAQNPAVTVNVDTQANRHAINPNIYGIAYGTPSVLSDLNVLLNRQGGNNTTRYNWQINADNRANDYYYESIGDPSAVPGERGDTFISNSKSAGAQSMLTIPLIDWVAKLGPNRAKLASFSVAKYGPQTSTDYWFPDAGNGVKSSGGYVTGNDPNDANVPNSVALQQGWVQHIVGHWGPASSGGLRYYLLDNESSLWFGTHRDVAPTGMTMDQMKTKMINYASMIKSVDPSALVVGPEEWGWDGFRFSGYDQQYGAAHNFSSYPDRAAHGNMDYVAYLLDQMHQVEVTNGKRLLDIFSLHFYPQGGEFGNDTSTNMQLLRNRSTRGLWDPNYVNESWIGTQVQLIPRMKNWVSAYYPGLPIAITEYNWGAEGHINGATTQADIYGIFGREGLDMATRWTYPDPSTPTYKAMKIYRNYDGNRSTFGDTSVSTTTANPDNLSSFGATRSTDGALTVMVINKVLSGSTPVTVNLAHFSAAGSAQVWQLTSTNAITQLASVPATTSVSLTVPAQSITLLVIPPTPTNSTALYQIDSGGGAVGTFSADNYFSGGVTASTSATINLAGVANAAPMAVYQSLRSAANVHAGLSYTFPGLNPGATYTVRLHFADYWISVVGARTFNVTLNGATALTNFDIYAAAGAAYKAVTRDCTGVADANGNLLINFIGVNGPAIVCGIEIIGNGSVPAPTAPTNLAASAGNALVNLTWTTASGAASYNVKRSLTSGGPYSTIAAGLTTTSYTNTGLTNGTTYYYVVTAVNSAGESATSNQASATPAASQSSALYQIDSGGGPVGTFSADNYFTEGVTASTTSAIDLTGVANAAPQGVYQCLRSAASIHANLSYTLSGLTAGTTYTVRLHFADYWISVAGARTFNVTINGAAALTNFDIFASAGATYKAVTRDCTGVADANGKLLINFIGVNGPAIVCGIEVLH